jgi:hypothetical protein
MQLEKVLADNGFRVIKRSQYQLLKEKKMLDAKNNEKHKLFRNIAQGSGAQYYISGMGVCYGPKTSESTFDTAGTIYIYEAMGLASVYAVDNGQILFNTTPQTIKKYSTTEGQKTIIESFSDAGTLLGETCVKEFLNHLFEPAWVTVTIENVSYGLKTKIVEYLLSKKPMVMDVDDDDYSDDVAKISIKTGAKTSKLASLLDGQKFDDYKLVVKSASGKTIFMTAKEQN